MNNTQLGILIGLGVLVLILFCFILWLAFGNRIRASFARAPQNTPVPQITSTPVIFATLTPTPTQTPIPYEQLVPAGWKQFKTELVEIWLPPTFKTMEKESDDELSLVGETSKNSLYRMRVLVSFKPLVGDSLDAFLDSELAKMDPQIRFTGRSKVTINSVEAVKINFETRVETVDVNEVVYVFQDGSAVWFVEYVAQINEFFDMLPVFEQSVKTFRTVK
jgi:hypothetical protein